MKWISLKDKLPTIEYKKKKTHREILAFDGKKIWNANFRYVYKINSKTNKKEIAGYVINTFCPLCCGGKAVKRITHWMELPSFPKKEKNKCS